MSCGNRVLLVDDDHEIAIGASLRLRAAGYEPIVAHSGDEGVASARRYRPEAIVLDLRMPGTDGLTALAELRQHEETKDIPVVMLSASLTDERATLDAGARFFVRKPYHAQTLLTAVATAIRESACPPAVKELSRSVSVLPAVSQMSHGAAWARTPVTGGDSAA
ncbi:MAG: response regulator [Planctomycetota bacterium]